MAIRVVISGTGNMGRAVLAALEQDGDFEPVGMIEKLSSDASYVSASGLRLPQNADPGALFDAAKPDVVIDFTNADWTPILAPAALERGVRLVIGTTGLSEDWISDLDGQCRSKGVGAVLAPNYAIGAVLLIHMAKIASRFFDSAEIIELHHDRKVDAPSGTALTTAREMLAARGKPFDRNEPEKEPLSGARDAQLDGLTIHSVRLPGFVAHEEVIFGGAAQTLTIRHDTSGRESFVPGVLLATKEVMQRRELVRSLEALFGLA
jgi:4-hydroxy-tetrahydrodipicolinate reductase